MAIQHIGRIGRTLYRLGVLSLGALSLSSLLAFADGSLRGPVTGLVHDAAGRAIHRIDGMPGAATMSQAVALEVDVQAAAFDSALRFALVANSTGEVYLVRDPAGDAPQTERLAGMLVGVERVALARSGKVAALYSPGRKTLQLVNGLPDAPKVFSSALLSEDAADVTALALLPGEAGALIASQSAGQSKVFRLNAAGEIVLMAEAGAVRALAVLATDAFVYADSGRNELVRVRGAGPGAEIAVLAGASDGVNDPRGLCRLDDGRLLLANAQGPALLAFDAEGRPTGSQALEFAPSRCDALGAGSVLLLNDAGRGPLYVLDYSQSLQVMFVPAAASERSRQ